MSLLTPGSPARRPTRRSRSRRTRVSVAVHRIARRRTPSCRATPPSRCRPGAVVPSLTAHNMRRSAGRCSARFARPVIAPGVARGASALVIPDRGGARLARAVRSGAGPPRRSRSAHPVADEEVGAVSDRRGSVTFTRAASRADAGGEFVVVAARRDVVRGIRSACATKPGFMPGSSTSRRFSVVESVSGQRHRRPATGWSCICGRTTPRSPSCAAAT